MGCSFLDKVGCEGVEEKVQGYRRETTPCTGATGKGKEGYPFPDEPYAKEGRYCSQEVLLFAS